jgi:4-hydroxy-3-methylbut-2-enyl diphosphate reductase
MAVKEISNHVEVFLIVGAQNSSNCNRLKEVAELNGVPAFLINSVEELDPKWLADVVNVGITSGASTPDSLVRGIIDFINPNKLIEMGGEEENITFTLPKELRGIRNA